MSVGWKAATAPGGVALEAPGIDVVDGAYVTSWSLERSGRPGRSLGAVYRPDGTLVPRSLRAGGHRGDTVVAADPPQVTVQDAPRLPGRWLYGGHWMGQFGHFITETMTNLWLLGEPVDGLLFHPFSWGAQRRPWQDDLLGRLSGGTDVPMHVVTEPLSVERLLVPSRPYVPNVAAQPQALHVWQRIAPPARPSRRVFLSRSRLETDPRRSPGDEGLDDLFARYGFEVVHPETLSASQQVDLAREALVLAGLSGSALHLSAFAPSGAWVMEVGDTRCREVGLMNQRVVDAAAGHRSGFVPLVTDGDGVRDLAATEATVRGLLES